MLNFFNTSLNARIFPLLFCAVSSPGLTAIPANIFVSCFFKTHSLFYFFVCHIPTYISILFSSNPATPLSIHPFFCPIVASNFFSFWDECPSNLKLANLF
jgi:hypothetical protein